MFEIKLYFNCGLDYIIDGRVGRVAIRSVALKFY